MEKLKQFITIMRPYQYVKNIFIFAPAFFAMKITNIDITISLIKLLKDLRFPSVRFAEDVPFGVCANVMAKQIVLTKSVRYFYRIRDNSLIKNTHY